MPRVSGIYGIYQGSQERYVYVGSSVNIRGRMTKHRSELRRQVHFNQHLQRSWNKYGPSDFWFVGIEECSDGQLPDRETYWLETLKPSCNIAKDTRAPARGLKRSAGTKARLSAAITGHPGHAPSDEIGARFSRLLKGKKKSDETKARISQSKMGHVVSVEARANMRAARNAYLHGSRAGRASPASEVAGGRT